MSARIIVYNEPAPGGDVERRVTVQEAIEEQKAIGHYNSDTEALADFLAVHWAYIDDR